MNYDNIPKELRKLPQWVVWDKDKNPCIPGTKRKAKSNDPSTWRTFEEAIADSPNRIGFVFTENDPYCGIDLDHCIENGKVKKKARVILDDMNSYTEFSPSGTGLHIIIKGGLPSGGNRKGLLEMYDSGRYFTMTGDILSDVPQTIENRQEELNALHTKTFPKEKEPKETKSLDSTLTDTEVLELIRNAANAAKFERLWDGDISEYVNDAGEPDQSRADAALCGMLAFYCDAAQIERLVSQSALGQREKWTGRKDYRERTIRSILSGRSETYTPSIRGGDLRFGIQVEEPKHEWLDNYVECSKKWSPDAYNGFHEACGLSVLSTVAARRIYVSFGQKQYTPMYIMLVARTSLFAKTTTVNVATETLRMAGLDWLVDTDEATPQKFLQDRTIWVPKNYEELSYDQQDRVTKRLGFAGQLGWFYDEFGMKIDQIVSGNSSWADYRRIIKKFDDCQITYTHRTIGRGIDTIERPYLSLLGCMTIADLQSAAQRDTGRMWEDGFFARFAFVCPNEKTDITYGRFPKGLERIIPTKVTDPLREWHERLGSPEVIIHERDEEGEGRKQYAEIIPIDPVEVKMGEGVYEAIYKLRDSLRKVIETKGHQVLDGNYNRFHDKALRIATLLASVENSVVEMRHWNKALHIVGRWKRNIESLYDQVSVGLQISDKEKQEAKLLKVLKKHGKNTAARIGQYVRGVDTQGAEALLQSLVRSGVIKAEETNRTTYYRI